MRLTNLRMLQVEAALTGNPYVENIMVHADPFHSFCVALIVPTAPVLETWARQQALVFSDFHDLCSKEEAVAEVLSSLIKVLSRSPLSPSS